MYITYVYKRKDKQLNIDDILDSLYNDTEYVEPKEKVNRVYNDLTYTRYRTININPLNVDDVVSKYRVPLPLIMNITSLIKSWLQEHKDEIGYHTFNIPKATGGYREINAPNETLKRFMQDIKYRLEYLRIYPHDSAYAYIKERDCKRALQRHQTNNANWFLKLDISKFFNNCTPAFIKKQLKLIYPFAILPDTCYNEFVDTLCDLACLNNELPQGTPLSPLITNWLMIPIDYQINKMLSQLDDNFYTYTRYADDMLISSKDKFNYNIIVDNIKDILESCGTPFQIKDEKTRFGSKAGRNWNLGIMYNKDNKLTVGYKRKRRIKTMLFQFYLGRIEREFVYQLNGELAYLKNIEPEYYYYFMQSLSNKYNYNFIRALEEARKQY